MIRKYVIGGNKLKQLEKHEKEVYSKWDMDLR